MTEVGDSHAGLPSRKSSRILGIPVNNRYEIQDILAQDESGVAFHAEDRKSKREVVLRRFFPFGVDGGGLEGEERTAYETAVRRLKKVSHPALRSVLDGGSDPVDGMPFLVTEWHEGEPLAERLKIRPLSPPSAKALADLALECCQILSDAFGEETVWIETDPRSVVLGGPDSDRKVTFWISSLRWLGGSDSGKGLQSIAEMIGTVTGWDPNSVPDQAGGGLGWWFKTLSQNPEIWNLEQAKKALHDGPPVANPTATVPVPHPTMLSSGPQTIPASAGLPHYQPSTRTVIWPWIVAGVLTTGALGFVAWQMTRKPPKPPSIAMGMEAEMLSEREAAAKASARAAEMAEALRSGRIERSPVVGETFSAEGLISSLRQSQSKKTTYLAFAKEDGLQITGIRYRTKQASIDHEELEALVRTKVRVTGTIVREPDGFMIALTKLDQIEPITE